VDGGFQQLEWAPDGQSIIASKNGPRGSGDDLELWRIPISGDPPQKFDIRGINGGFAVHPDGRRIAFTTGQRKNEVWAIENFLPMLQAKK
jgi:Tol biopolymer transport system component